MSEYTPEEIETASGELQQVIDLAIRQVLESRCLQLSIDLERMQRDLE